jgi:hypothetical protein
MPKCANKREILLPQREEVFSCVFFHTVPDLEREICSVIKVIEPSFHSKKLGIY